MMNLTPKQAALLADVSYRMIIYALQHGDLAADRAVNGRRTIKLADLTQWRRGRQPAKVKAAS